MSVTFTEFTPENKPPAAFDEMFSIWCDLKPETWLPSAKSFHLDELPVKLLPWSILVDVIGEGDDLDFRFRFWGTERTQLIGADMTGRLLSEIADEAMREGNTADYREVCRRGIPLLCDTPVTTATGRAVSITSFRVPLAGEDKPISRIFSATDPQTITSQHYEYFGTERRLGP